MPHAHGKMSTRLEGRSRAGLGCRQAWRVALGPRGNNMPRWSWSSRRPPGIRPRGGGSKTRPSVFILPTRRHEPDTRSHSVQKAPPYSRQDRHISLASRIMASDFQFFSSPAKDGAAAQPEAMTPAADLIQKWGSKADRMTISVLSTPGEQLIGAKVCSREGEAGGCRGCRHQLPPLAHAPASPTIQRRLGRPGAAPTSSR